MVMGVVSSEDGDSSDGDDDYGDGGGDDGGYRCDGDGDCCC